MSNCDPSRFARGFETMMNLMNVSASEQTVKKSVEVFVRNPCFEEFVATYKKIVESALKESVAEYF